MATVEISGTVIFNREHVVVVAGNERNLFDTRYREQVADVIH